MSYARFKTRNANAQQPFTDQAVGVSYDFGFLRVSLAQRRWSYLSDRTASTLLGVVVPAGAGVVKASVVRAVRTGTTAVLSGNDATLIGVGYVYNLSKRTAIYGHAARVANKGNAAFAIPGGPATSGVATAPNFFGGQTSSGIEFGVRHDF